MIICETIGLFVAIMVCVAVLALILCAFFSGDVVDLDDDAYIVSFCGIMVLLVFIASVEFVQFRHYPEQFGYTAIEEVEEVEVEE